MSRLLWAWLGLALLYCGSAFAHQQGSSYSQWHIGDGGVIAVNVKVSELDLTRAELHPDFSKNYRQQVAAYLQARLRLKAQGAICPAQSASVRQSVAGWLQVSWKVDCPATEQHTLSSTILLDVAPGHLHFARWDDGAFARDYLLTEERSIYELLDANDAETESALLWPDFLQLGVVHILSGWDHLAFVLGLLLLATKIRSVLWLVTGFTLGHSVTLALATLGWITPNTQLIEAVIAWSIALVAADYCWQRYGCQRRWSLLPLGLLGFALLQAAEGIWLALAVFTLAYFIALSAAPQRSEATRAAVTMAFGLIHGCGFAAILNDLSLETEQLALSLFSFNLGVELGQLLVVALVWPLLGLFRAYLPNLQTVLAIGLLAVASYWWVSRVVI